VDGGLRTGEPPWAKVGALNKKSATVKRRGLALITMATIKFECASPAVRFLSGSEAPPFGAAGSSASLPHGKELAPVRDGHSFQVMNFSPMRS
ncbi:MAG: hypothetical protein WB713_16255, partial [Methyloceanibacter sp.]